MRHSIDTAPRDGKFVILEDDVSGRFEFAQWSAEARGWVRENGEPSEITPTHWQTRHLPQEGDEFILQDEFVPQEETGLSPSPSRAPRSFRFPSGQAALEHPEAKDVLRQVAKADPVTVVRLPAQAAHGKSEREPRAHRWSAVFSIAAVMVGASLIGWYFHAELAAYVTRYGGAQEIARTGKVGVEVAEQKNPVPIDDSQKADSGATAQGKQGAQAQQPVEKEQRRADAPANEQAAQLSQVAEIATAELRQSLQKERDRAEALAGELAKARRDLETQLASPSKARDQTVQRNQAAEKATAELRQSLKAEHERAEALTGELARARRDLATQLALASKAGDEAAQVKQAAESATAELRQSLKTEHDRAEGLSGELVKAQQDIKTQVALASKAGDEAEQLKQLKEAAESATAELRRSLKAAERATAELRQSLQKEHDRAETLASELATARTTIYAYEARARKTSDQAADLKQAAESATAELRQSLQKEHDRAEALASELAKARRDAETQLTLASNTGDEAAQLKQVKAAESATAELRQSLQKEHDRAEVLSGELVKAQRDIKTQVALASKAGDEAAQLRQLKETAESTAAELRQSLQKKHDRAEALAQARGPAQPTIEARIAVDRASSSQIAQVTQAVEVAAIEQPVAAEAQGGPEAARLLARASALLSQGNIGAARIVLELAVQTGSAQASFKLAETYDPLVLSTWKTYGTRGDVTKARELYARALAGGIQEAKGRSVALR